MPVDPGPHDLGSTRVVMDPRGTSHLKAVTPAFFEELDAEFGGFANHVLISRFEFAEPWPTWEMHPMGDELVYLLSGDVELVLWLDGRERRLRVDKPGTYVIVPQGAWHTARPRRPTSMLFVTPGQGTRNADAPG
jgi:mannose-6-phosphate isomerase-like protein (cupin superfamily)